jgi:hypothetical protein
LAFAAYIASSATCTTSSSASPGWARQSRARGHRERAVVDDEVVVDLVDQALRERCRLLLAVDDAHHDVLVPRHPGHRVAGAGAPRQSFGHGHEHGVPGGVPQVVVHLLEAIEVQEHDGDH